jgi:hypothetical protein
LNHLFFVGACGLSALVPVAGGCVSVGGAGAFSVSLHPPTVTSAAATWRCRSYPWRSKTRRIAKLPLDSICKNRSFKAKIFLMKKEE